MAKGSASIRDPDPIGHDFARLTIALEAATALASKGHDPRRSKAQRLVLARRLALHVMGIEALDSRTTSRLLDS